MGGIIGKLSFEHDETLARPVLEQMLGALRHRGSTGSGIHVAPGIALGWCGDEPAGDPSVARYHTVFVVADAALTNARELLAELTRCGHQDLGTEASQLIAHAYAEWGDACIERLRGAFACAIWDGARERLLLARDAIGIKPLFFAMLHGHGVVFGSEIRPLLQDPGVGREWCPQAIDAYLALGYVPAPLTAYQRVSKLEPAQRLVVEGRRLHVDQYWDLPIPDEFASPNDIVDALDTQLRHALRDRPVDAVLYSGGLVSSTILTTLPPGDHAVVTVAVDDDAAWIARSHAAAGHLGFEPSIEVATPDIASIAPQLAAHFDEPLADPTAVTHYATLVAARGHARTALAGHGASALWTGLIGAGQGHKTAAEFWDGPDRRAIYTRGFAWEVRDADPFSRYTELYRNRPTDDPLDHARYVVTRTVLPDNTLAIAERSALAAGIELRLPFLERELVELAAVVPSALRQRELTATHPLRALLSRRLPQHLIPPVAAPVRQHSWLPSALATMVPTVLLAPRFDGRGVVSRPVLRHLWEEHTTGRRDHAHRLWSLLMLEFWFREFIDGDAADEPIEYAILRAA